jgi:hypothetical protein
MKGNSVEPGGPLESKPTRLNAFGCLIASFLFLLLQGAGAANSLPVLISLTAGRTRLLVGFTMSPATPKMRDLAELVLVHEAAEKREPSPPHPSGTGESTAAAEAPASTRAPVERPGLGDSMPLGVAVFERLSPQLANLMGNGGAQALLARALAMARSEVPALARVHIDADGFLTGWDELAAVQDLTQTAEANVVLVAHLLSLLVAFIGEPLTLRLIREAWPDRAFPELNSAPENPGDPQ